MFNTVSGAMERIAYQANSNLSREMTALCQMTLDQVTALGEEGKVLDPRAITRKMKYFKEFRDAATKLLNEETGLSVRNVIVTPFGCINAYMSPEFTSKTGISVTELWQALDNLQGFGGKKLDARYSDILDNLSKKSDLKTGKIDKELSKVYQIDIGLATELFTSVHNYHAEAAFTAEEIAAIILHEAGHGMTFAEHLGNVFYRALEARDSFALLTEKGSPEARVNLVKDVSKAVSEIKDPGRQKGYKELLEAAESHSDENRKAVTVAHIGLDILIGNILGMALSPLLIPGMIGTMAGRYIGRQIDAATVIYYGAKGKASDVMVTPQGMTVTERIADEYVSRHGLGQPLATALKKLTTNAESTKKVGHPALRFISGIGIGMADAVIAAYPVPMSIPYSTPYDDTPKRLALLVQNNMSIFKDPDLPADVRNQWIRETETLLKNHDTLLKTRWPEKVSRLIWDTLLRMNTTSTLTGTFINANLQSDYAKLQDWSRGLIRNQLYFRAAQVKQLIGSSRKS